MALVDKQSVVHPTPGSCKASAQTRKFSFRLPSDSLPILALIAQSRRGERQMTGEEWSSLCPFHFGSHAEQRACLALLGNGDDGREQAENFIHDCFSRAHHADVRHFLPELL